MLAQFLAVAVLVEALGESIWWFQVGEDGQRGWNQERVGALLLGLILSLVSGLNVFDLVGLQPAAYLPPIVWAVVGVAGTGLVVMRGANFVHDLISRVQAGQGSPS